MKSSWYLKKISSPFLIGFLMFAITYFLIPGIEANSLFVFCPAFAMGINALVFSLGFNNLGLYYITKCTELKPHDFTIVGEGNYFLHLQLLFCLYSWWYTSTLPGSGWVGVKNYFSVKLWPSWTKWLTSQLLLLNTFEKNVKKWNRLKYILSKK